VSIGVARRTEISRTAATTCQRRAAVACSTAILRRRFARLRLTWSANFSAAEIRDCTLVHAGSLGCLSAARIFRSASRALASRQTRRARFASRERLPSAWINCDKVWAPETVRDSGNAGKSMSKRITEVTTRPTPARVKTVTSTPMPFTAHPQLPPAIKSFIAAEMLSGM
jgi:hypothetical protein